MGDLRIGLRMLLRSPAVTTLTVLTLALGIGANTAIFSVIHGVLLAELPYPESERLVQVWNKYPLMDLPQASVSIPDYFDRREGVEAFEESALYNYRSFNLTGEGPPERLIGVHTTATLFPLLKTQAWLGTAFSEEEDQPGRDNVVVLSYALWQSRFGGDRSLVGRDIRLNGEPHRVLGVMGEGFAFPNPRVRLWKPFAPTPEQRSDDARGHEFSSMVARLAPGASIEQAQSQIDAIHERNRERFPEVREFWESSGFGGMVIDYREELFGSRRPMLLLLQAVVGLVLLIACANVANLLLARLNGRRKELAVRTAMGAGRLALARQLLVESLLLGLLGGAAGIAVGALGLKLLSRFGIDPAAGTIATVQLNLPVLGATLVLALLTGVVFGLFPIVSLWRLQPNAILKEGGDRGSSSRGRTRHFLVIAEMAMALMLLVGAGLLIRTFVALQDEDPGFSHENVVTAQVRLPNAKYGDDDPKIVLFYEQALERIRALPGVKSAGVITAAPFSGSSSSGSYSIEGYEPGAGEAAPHALVRVVDEDYFETLEISVLTGRGFESSDALVEGDGDGVVVVDRTLVEKYWPESDPIGQRLRRGGPDSSAYRIVGVVEPVKVSTLERPITKETIYFPYRQNLRRGMTFVVKAELLPTAFAGPLRDAILEVDPELPLYNVNTLEAELAASLTTQRVSMILVVTFGLLAVVLASIGIYGVLSFSVGQRIREIGTRVALGAAPRQILQLIVGQGMAWTLIGLVTGVVASLVLGRFLEAMLFGVTSWDPATFLAVGPLLAAVSFLACYRPARRATRIDPLEALREE